MAKKQEVANVLGFHKRLWGARSGHMLQVQIPQNLPLPMTALATYQEQQYSMAGYAWATPRTKGGRPGG